MTHRPLAVLSIAALTIGVVSGAIAALVLSPAEAAFGGRWFVSIKNLGYWGAWSALMPLAVHTAAWIRRQRWPAIAAVAAHIGAAIGFALTHLSALSALNLVLVAVFQKRAASWPAFFNSIVETPRIAVEWELTMYGGFVAFAYAADLRAEVQRRALAEAELEAGLAKARLLSLQRQLQPHFLFNTLHAVAALIARDPAAAESMIVRLSQLLRTTFRSDAAAEVSLATELDVLHDYLAIEAVQMRERLSVAFQIDPAITGAAVPVLFMQPLVENAVRHGIQPRASGGHITVSAAVLNGRLRIDIVDDGVGLGSFMEHPQGVGLTNTRSRLEHLYGANHTMTVEDRDDGGGVRVAITMPFRLIGAENVGVERRAS